MSKNGKFYRMGIMALIILTPLLSFIPLNSGVIEQEEKYWTEDEKLDEVYAANAEEEYKGQSLYEELGAESYLAEL